MKIKFSLLLACITLTHFACKKTETTGEQPVVDPPVAKVKLLTKITSTPKGSSTSSVTTFTYDDKKRLISFKPGSSEYTFSYNDRSELLKRVNGPFGSTSELEPTYESGRIRYISSKTYKTGALQSETTYGYVYSGNNVVEVDQNQGVIREVTYKLDYVGDNCVKFTSDDPTYPFYKDFTYDDKKTPYEGSNARVLMGLILGPFPVHNILTQKMTYTTITQTTQSTSVFTYDANGLPLTEVRTSTFNGGSASETNITYQYTEF